MRYATTLQTLLRSCDAKEIDAITEAVREQVALVMQHYPLLNPSNAGEFYCSYMVGFVGTVINFTNTGYIDTAIGAEALLDNVSYFEGESGPSVSYLVGFSEESAGDWDNSDRATLDHTTIAYELAGTMQSSIVNSGTLWGIWKELSSKVTFGRPPSGLKFTAGDLSSTDSIISAETPGVGFTF